MNDYLLKRAEAALKFCYESRKHVEAMQRDLARLSMDVEPLTARLAMEPLIPVTAKMASDEIREQSWALRCELAAILAEERTWREIYEMTRP